MIKGTEPSNVINISYTGYPYVIFKYFNPHLLIFHTQHIPASYLNISIPTSLIIGIASSVPGKAVFEDGSHLRVFELAIYKHAFFLTHLRVIELAIYRQAFKKKKKTTKARWLRKIVPIWMWSIPKFLPFLGRPLWWHHTISWAVRTKIWKQPFKKLNTGSQYRIWVQWLGIFHTSFFFFFQKDEANCYWSVIWSSNNNNSLAIILSSWTSDGSIPCNNNTSLTIIFSVGLSFFSLRIWLP